MASPRSHRFLPRRSSERGVARRSLITIATLAMLAALLPLAPAAQAAGNNAVQLDGSDDAINLGAGGGSPLGATNFTLELWFMRTGTGSAASTGTGGIDDSIPLISKGRSENDGSNIDTNYFLGIDASSGELEADFEDQDASNNNNPVNGSGAIPMNEWHHAAATYNGTLFCLYLDGVLNGSCTATTNTPRSDSIQIPAVGTAYNSGGAAVGRFAGRVDEVRIWNVARSQSEIQATMSTDIGSATAGLLGQWAMDEGTGTTAANAQGSAGISGTLQGGATWVAGAPALDAPITNYGVQLDGTNDYVTFGTASSLGASQFTLELWFNWTGGGDTVTTGTSGIPNAIPLLTKGRGEADNGSNVDTNYFLGINASTGVLAADFEEGAGGASPSLNHPIMGSTAITTNEWHHAAATYDASGTWRLYLDGVLDGTLAVGQPPRADSIQHAGIGTAMTSNGTADGFFAGTVDEARIWNVARSGAEILDGLDEEITSGTGLLGRWGLNEGTGTTAAASVGPNGTLTNSPTWVEGTTFTPPAPITNHGVQMDGTNDHIDLGASSATALGASQFTLELWFRWNGSGDPAATSSTTSGLPSVIPLITKGRSEDDGSNVDVNYFFGIDTATGRLAADFEEGAGGASPGLNHGFIASTSVSTNVWHHGAVTYDGTQFRIYLDGNLDGTGPAFNQPPRSDSVHHVGIGTAFNSSGAADGAFGGTVDEVRIWNLARTGPQILDGLDEELTSGTGLLGRWGLNEGTGTTAAASVGPNGTLVNGPTWVEGAPFTPPTPITNYGLQMDGTNDYVTFGTAAGLGATNFTLELWFRWNGGGDTTTTGTGGVANAIPLLTKGRGEQDNSNLDMNYFLGIDAGTGVLAADFEEGAGGASPGLNHPIMGATAISTGVWHHAAATYDGTWRLYLDGVLDASLAINQPPRADSIQHSAIGSALTSNGTADGFFAGAVDEARVWNVARSESQIQDGLDEELTSGSGLVGRWGMNEGSGTTLGASVGPNGTLTNGPAWVAGTPFTVTPPSTGKAVQIDGVSTHGILLGSPGQLGAAQFTLELWFKRTGAGVFAQTSTLAGGLDDSIPLITKGRSEADASNVDTNYYLGIDASSGELEADFEDMASGGNHGVNGSGAVSMNVWHHAAATYDGNNLCIYLDGVQNACGATGNAVPRSDSIHQPAVGTAFNSTGTALGSFAGAVDEVRIWNVARTPAEIQASMNLELSSGPGLIGRWALNEGAGTSSTGSVGGINAALTTGTSWTDGAPSLSPASQPPATPVVVAPTDGATDVVRPPTLDVTVDDTDSQDLDVTFFGRPTGTGPSGEDFTIVAIPDTQYYVDYLQADQATRNGIYQAQMNWIVSSADDLNTAFASHLGDITQNFQSAASEVEWQKASAYQAILDSNGIKNNVLPGNHDFNSSYTNTQFYDQYFPPSRYQSFNWYGGYLGDPTDGIADGGQDRLNKDNYELFSAGGMDFLIIHLEMDMPAYTTTWAQNVIDAYPNRHVIISTHAFLNNSGQRPTSPQYRADGQSAQAVWTSLIAPNCQIFMVINGHYHGHGRRTDNNSCGEPVFQLNSDYQDFSNGGNGFLRYYTFHPAQDQIEAFTYSPTLNSFDSPLSDDSFTLNWEMDGPAPFQQIGAVQHVQAGDHATVSWNGLNQNAEYEWYATVTDGDSSVQGPTSSFTTEVPPPTPPVVDSVTITPASPKTDDTLTANVTAHDANDDPLTYTYEWFKNGSPVGGNTATLSLVTAGNGDRGDQMTVRVTAHDASSASAPVTSAGVTIVNAPPTATVQLSDDTPASSSTVTATATKADADNDTVTLTYVWTVNGAVRQTTNTTALTDTFDLSISGNGSPGDALAVTVTPNDGAANGSPAVANGVVSPDVIPPIFEDDFSSGNLGNWTGSTAGMTVDGTFGDGAPSARGQVSGAKANAFVTLASPISGQTCFSADVNLTSGSTSLLNLQTATGTKIIRVMVNATNKLTIKSDAGGATFNSKVNLGSGWHDLELCVTAGPSSLADLYRDGVQIVNDWSTSTGSTPVGRIMIGDPANKTVTIHYDNVRLDQVAGDGVVKPSTPGTPFGNSPASGTIQISWAASTGGVAPITYRVYRDGGGTPIGTTMSTSYSDINLTIGEQHSYTVDAVDNVGSASAMSPASSLITVGSGPQPALFFDSFTSGNTSQWTVVQNLAIDNSNGAPAPSLGAQTSGAAVFAYKDLGTTYSTVCMSIDVNLQTSTATALMRLRQANGANLVKVYVNAAGKIQIRSDVSATAFNSQVVLGSGWHNLEVCGTIGTATTWDVYRDGVVIIDNFAASTGLTPIGRIQIGDSATKAITINYDNVRLDQLPG